MRLLEDLGFDSILVPDQMVGPGWSSMLALTAAAVATTDLRVGNLALNNDMHNPVVLAREAATLDVISGGRYELGLGAGWLDRDYQSTGMAFDRGRVRVSRLREAVALIKRLFAGEEVTFEGEFYKVARAECRPVSVQRPRPPILIAGGGPEILALAGAEADIVAIGLQGVGRTPMSVDVVSADAVRAQLEFVRAGAGERIGQLEISTFIHVVLTPDRERTLDEMATAGCDSAVARSSIFMAVGNLTEIEAHIVRLREDLGITYFCLRGPHLFELGPVVEELAGKG